MKNYNKAKRKDRYYGIVIEEFSFIEWVCDNMRIIPTYKSKFSKKKAYENGNTTSKNKKKD